MGTARRVAGVLAGVVLGGATVGLGMAHADGIVLGCPPGYTLGGTTCRSADGSTVPSLGLLPGDVDPETGAVLLPGPVPTTTPPLPTTTLPVPTTTLPVPTTTLPVPTTTLPVPTAPPVVLPCPRPVTAPAAGPDVVRTAAAVDEARARLAADVRRGATPDVIRDDVRALSTAIRAHAAALATQRQATCPTR